MWHRDLAAIAATASVAATPAAAIVAAEVTNASPAAATVRGAGTVVDDPFVEGPDDCVFLVPSLSGQVVQTTIFSGSFFGGPIGPCRVPGTLSLQASVDGSHWKTLAQTHTPDMTVSHACLEGVWSYRGFYVADDGSFKGGTDDVEPRQFSC